MFPTFLFLETQKRVHGSKYMSWRSILKRQNHHDAMFYCHSHNLSQSIAGQLCRWAPQISELKRFPAVKAERPHGCMLFRHFWSEILLAADPSWVPELWIGIVISFLTTSHTTVGEGKGREKVRAYTERKIHCLVRVDFKFRTLNPGISFSK